jgi:hypothetical protein
MELSMRMKMFFVLSGTIGHVWHLSTQNEASVAEELDFRFYLILSNLNNHMWLLATLLDSASQMEMCDSPKDLVKLQILV